MAIPEGLTLATDIPAGLTPATEQDKGVPAGLSLAPTADLDPTGSGRGTPAITLEGAEAPKPEVAFDLEGTRETLESFVPPGIKTMAGIGEAAAQITTEFVAQGAAALGALPYTFNTAINKAEQAVAGTGMPGAEKMSVANAFVEIQKATAETIHNVIGYKPRTQTGMEYSASIGALFEFIREWEESEGEAVVEGLNSHYVETKEKLASGEIDSNSVSGVIQDMFADAVLEVAPLLGTAFNISIEAPLMLGPFAKGRRAEAQPEPGLYFDPKITPKKRGPIPPDTPAPKQSMLESARPETARELTIPDTPKPSPETSLYLPPPKSQTIPPYADVQKALAQFGDRPYTPVEVALARADILNPMAVELQSRRTEIEAYVKSTPLPEGVHWQDEIASLKVVRNQAQALKNRAKSEYFKDTAEVILKDIDIRLDLARMAEIMERRGEHLEWVATSSVERAMKRAERNKTTINEELNNVFNEFVPKETLEMGTKYEYGPDLRPAKKVLEDLIETSETGKGTTIKRAAYPDMGFSQRYIAGNLLAGKQVGQLHPLVKWAVDIVGRANTEIAIKTENFIFDVQPSAKGKFGTGLRVARREKGTEGAFVALEEINLHSPKEIETLRSAAYEYEFTNPVREADASYFESRGVSPRAIRAYQDLRIQLERVRTYLNDTIRKHNERLPEGAYKLAPIEYLPSFLPHLWEGEFRVHIRQGNKHIQTLPAGSKLAATRLAKSMEKEGYNTSISSKRRELTRGEDAMNSFQNALKFLADDSPAVVEIRKQYMAMSGARGYKVHARKRKNITGFMGLAEGAKGNREFFKSNKRFIESAVEFGEFMKARGEVNQVLSDPFIQKKYPNAVKQVNNYMYNASGAQGFASKTLDTAIRAISKEYLTGDMVRTGIGKLNMMALYNYLFFGNIRFFAMQGLQPHLVLPAKLVQLQNKGVKGDMIYSELMSTKDAINPSKEATEVIRFGIDQKVINPNFVEQFAGETQRYMGWQSATEASIDIMSGRQLAGYLEEMTRMKAMLNFYHFFKSSGMSKKEAMQSAGYHTRIYMVEYNTAERPLVFGESGLGTAGKTVGLFQTWQMNYLGQLYEYAREASFKNPKTFKPLFMTALMQVFMAGIQGVTGMALAQQLSEIGQRLGWVEKTVQEKLAEWDIIPDFLMYGVPSAATGVDMSTSLSAPSSILENFVASPGLEFGEEIAISAFNWGFHSLREGAHPGDAMRFWKAIAPSSMDGWVEAAYTPGLHAPVPNPKKGMRGEVRRELRDWAPRLGMAARSLRERRVRDTLWLMQKVKDRETASLGDIVAVGAKIWHQQNMGSPVELPEWMFDKAEELGANPAQFMDKIKTKVEAMEKDMWEQITQLGRTKEGREAMEKFEKLNGSYYGENIRKN